MKKVLSFILGVVAIVALILGSAENPDGSCNLLWTLSCLGVSAASGWLLGKVNPELNPLKED
jgi:hypothetical protein